MWRHRAVWYVGSDVLSHSTELNPHDVSRTFRDASNNCTRIAGVTTLRKNGIDKFYLSYCSCHLYAFREQLASENVQKEVCSYPIFFRTFRVVTKKSVD